MSNQLTELAQAMRPAVDEEMRLVLEFDGQKPPLFQGMLHYHMGWVDTDLQPNPVASGKQIRPILCLLSTMATSGRWSQAVPAAAAIELLHNFSLIHDDIEDASPTRRGRRTLWHIWGVEQAINAGDAMFALAHLAMNRLVEQGVEAAIVVQALRRFDETCVRLTEGQHADMDFEKRAQVSVEAYLNMITGKTAVLLSLCAELGALIGGSNTETIQHYAAFGRDLGLAFQVKDDILGIWGNEDLTGKSAATDVVTRKKTLPVLYGLSQSAALRQLYEQEETDEAFVKQVVHYLDESGARAYAHEQARHYSENALNHLQAVEPSGPAGEALTQLADMLLNRDY